MTSGKRPSAAFIGTRAEALEALRAEADVTFIICLAGSRAHDLCLQRGLAATVLDPSDRPKAMRLLVDLREDLLLSAGFPWIIDASTLAASPARKLNSHPSLLPSFPGKDAIRDALRAGSMRLGVTVHDMTAEVDAGPIIAQESIEILDLELPEIYELLFGVVEPRVVAQALRSVISGMCR